jgi:hypothetical protein
MVDAHDSLRAKVETTWRELVGERAQRLDGSRCAEEVISVIALAMREDVGDEQAQDIAFHLTDWNSDAAFLVALCLYPERFTSEEVAAGVLMFLCHAPNHVAAAAHLAGWPVKDIFQLGLSVLPERPGESS